MSPAVLLAVFFVLPAAAQSDPKTAALDAFLAAGGAPRLASFLAQTGGLAAFAAAGPDDPASRQADWKNCEDMMSGGRRDPDGSAVRAALAKLPPRHLYFAGRLYAAMKALHAELGGGRWGNVKENLGLCTGRLCYERANTLQQRMEKVRADPAFSGQWDSSMPDAAPGALDEHTAVCYAFYPGSLGGEPSVELVADAWDDAFIPPQTWFAVHDPKTRDALAAAGKDWCGRTLQAVRKPQRDRLIEEENRADARKSYLKEFGKKLARESALGL